MQKHTITCRLTAILSASAATVLATSLWAYADAAPKLTCSFIHKRCITECVKQAGRGFCQFHCDGERRSCKSTGRWSSFGRTFDNVVRR